MKTFILVFTLLIFSGINTYAEKEPPKEESWDFFGLMFAPGIPTSANDSNIAGIRVGIPFAGGTNEVRGIEVGVIACATQTVYGIQTAPILCGSKTLTGIQASPVNFCDKLKGLQFGLFNASNHASFQIGIINYNEKAWIPILPIINWNFDD